MSVLHPNIGKASSRREILSCFEIEKAGRRQWQPTPVLLAGKSHGWRSLVGCSPWSRQESDKTERLHFHFSFFIHWRKWQPTPVFLPGESQGRGSQWAAVYGVAQSRTWLKRLSSSSKNISRNFSGAVVGSVGSVQFQIVPCSSLYLCSSFKAPSNA